MNRRYAEGTTVGAGSTKGQIEDMLIARGVDRFGTMADANNATIMFSYAGLTYRMAIALPDPQDEEFTHYVQRGTKYERAATVAREKYVGELNRRWRALAAVIKAKLIAVDEGITTFESEFLAHISLAGGETFGEHYIPKLQQAALSGSIPSALPMPGERK